MKRTKIMSLILASVLTVALTPQTAFAGVVNQCNTAVEANEGIEQKGTLAEGLQVSAENQLSVTTRKVDKSLQEKEAPEDLMEKLDVTNVESSIEEKLELEEGETSTPNLYYGTVTGNLTDTNDYDLYSIPLTEGQYLQLRLAVPTDTVDYDLLLLDSSLSTIKTSDYYAYNNGSAGVLDESVGYIASSNETVYVAVYSVNGGSSTDAYTLDFTIGENTYDSSEPDENAKEAATLTFTSLSAGANASRTLCSPLDNDWYTFTVPNSVNYDQIRFSLTSSSTTNGCSFEIYQNIGVDGYAMSLVTASSGGEAPLPAGKYYLRVISTNTFSTYDVTDVPTYTLSLLPVSRVDEILWLEYTNTHSISYNEGTKERVDGTAFPGIPKRVGLRGKAVYVDENGIKRESVNAIVTCKVENTSYTTQNQPNLATTQQSAVVNSDGVFTVDVYFHDGLGLNRYEFDTSVHKYDVMKLRIYYRGIQKRYDEFYYLVSSIYKYF